MVVSWAAACGRRREHTEPSMNFSRWMPTRGLHAQQVDSAHMRALGGSRGFYSVTPTKLKRTQMLTQAVDRSCGPLHCIEISLPQTHKGC